VTAEPAASFVHFIQNHDQVANTTGGERCAVTSSAALVRTMTALTLLGPQTPMLFMGQEIGSKAPFTFFADHVPDLARAVHRGRREFLAQFESSASESGQAAVRDPSDRTLFEAAKLDLGAHRQHEPWYRLHRDLLRIRREEPSIAAQSREAVDGAVLTERGFVLRWYGPGRELLLVVNLGRHCFEIAGSEPLLACGRDEAWALSWSSEHPDYGGSGVVSPLTESGWGLPALCAVLLHLDPKDDR
jgi:maltooligosyltrehalose trehalohydrolase